MFQESMVIPSLYTMDEQVLIERWIEQEPVYKENGNLKDSNKVAEIALSSVQAQLPLASLIQEDGIVAIGRKSWDCPVSMRNNLLSPIHIIEIKPDNAHTGLSCVEAYYATLLPGYNKYAVTISYGSEDPKGYFDLAIGSFLVDNAEQITTEASKVILSWWQFRFQELSRSRWEELLREEVWNKV